MKRILALSIIFFVNLFILPAFSKNDLYQKIDLFGEVLENIKSILLVILTTLVQLVYLLDIKEEVGMMIR